jgi:hypothetical protein
MDVELEVLQARYPNDIVLQDNELAPEIKAMLVALHTAKDDSDDLCEKEIPDDELDDDERQLQPDEAGEYCFETMLQRKTATIAALQNEDPPEIREVDAPLLQPLPKENDKNYPQENKAYFAKKNYCRKDKYLLEDIIGLQPDFPSTLSAFKTNPK